MNINIDLIDACKFDSLDSLMDNRVIALQWVMRNTLTRLGNHTLYPIIASNVEYYDCTELQALKAKRQDCIFVNDTVLMFCFQPYCQPGSPDMAYRVLHGLNDFLKYVVWPSVIIRVNTSPIIPIGPDITYNDLIMLKLSGYDDDSILPYIKHWKRSINNVVNHKKELQITYAQELLTFSQSITTNTIEDSFFAMLHQSESDSLDKAASWMTDTKNLDISFYHWR